MSTSSSSLIKSGIAHTTAHLNFRQQSVRLANNLSLTNDSMRSKRRLKPESGSAEITARLETRFEREKPKL